MVFYVTIKRDLGNMEVVVVKDGQRLPLRPTCGQAVYETACSFAGNDEELTVKSASNRICPSQHGRLSTQGKERAYFTRGRYLSCRSQMVLKKALTISCSRSIRTDGGKFINRVKSCSDPVHKKCSYSANT